jgi:hypothetical protein
MIMMFNFSTWWIYWITRNPKWLIGEAVSRASIQKKRSI